MKPQRRIMLAMATKVLNDYSKVLAALEPANLGFAQSFLPHSKAAIRQATITALSHLGAAQPQLREALQRGYVYLEQFVPDDEAEVLMLAALPVDVIDAPGDESAAQNDQKTLSEGQQVNEIITRIKVDMARALQEISSFR
jgi:hypothetical protein